MALGQKYQINKHDRHDIAWTTKIYEEGYTGAITYFIAADAEPAQLNDCNESDDPIDPIKDKRFYVNVFSTSMFGLADFYSAEEMVLWAEVYQGLSLYMAGWVDPGEYEEAYGPAPYVARICIVDGLSILPKLKYEASEGVPYNGHKFESAIIRDILGKIGFTTFREYVNVYEINMDSGVSDSPFDQCMINTDVFSDNEMYCDEVLKEILKSYGACIRQQGGVFNIYRPKELTGATVYGRYFTGDTTKTAISFTPTQYIKRTGYATTYHQMPGSRIMIQRPAKKVIINQDYGKKDSWLDNWQIKGSTFDGTDFDYWTRGAAYEYCKPIGDYVSGEKDGLAIIDTELSPTFFIYQDIGALSVITSYDIVIIDFDYGYYNVTAAQINSVDITVVVKQGSYYLNEVDDLTCEWTLTPSQIQITQDVPSGWTGWLNYKRQAVGLEASGTIRVSLYTTEWAPDVYACYRNIKVSISSVEISRFAFQNVIKDARHRQSISSMSRNDRQIIVAIKEIINKEYSHDNSINGEELNYDCMIGDIVDTSIDNVIEQFAGALAVSVRDSLAVVAAAFVTAHAADYSGGGVVVTSDGNKIIFTSSVAGQDFTGSTTIVNTDGDISGTAATVQPNIVALSAVARIDEVVISGTSGDFYIICDGLQRTTFWAGTLDDTGAQFVTDHAAAYAAGGVTVTYNAAANTLIFTSSVPGVDFTGDTSFVNLEGDISGIVYNEATANREATEGQARIDEITLSGASGTANITCDGVTEEVFCVETITPSSTWNTRGGAEADPLLQIVCDEIALMRSRPRQFVDMIIQEQTKAATNLNLLGNFQDIINIFGTNMRAFIVNRGTFNVKSRTWKLDLIEIGEGDAISESTTADSTDVTADNNIITVDSN